MPAGRRGVATCGPPALPVPEQTCTAGAVVGIGASSSSTRPSAPPCIRCRTVIIRPAPTVSECAGRGAATRRCRRPHEPCKESKARQALQRPSCAQPAHSRELGVRTQILPTKKEQVSDDRACTARVTTAWILCDNGVPMFVDATTAPEWISASASAVSAAAALTSVALGLRRSPRSRRGQASKPTKKIA